MNNKKIVSSAGRLGPLIGSLLGAIPQCGFSASATNFYITRIISLGTLVSVYLSTSDEMLPIMIAEGIDIVTILKIIGLKVLIGMLFGFIIDFVLRKRKKLAIEDFCEHDHCNCEHGIVLPALHHTFNIMVFILIISFVLNCCFSYLGDDFISRVFFKNNILSAFISSLVGLIPNCGSSIMITQLYLNNTITFGSAMAGLLTGSGIGILILFRNSKNLKENFAILGLIYFIGVISGIIIDLVGMF